MEVGHEVVTLTTKYESGLIAVKEMSIIEKSNDRLIAHHFDDILGITVFVLNPEEITKATLTLMNNDYIVGRYLRAVDKL